MRVVIADDEALLRAGLQSLLTSGGADVVGQAGDRDTLIQLALSRRPDVVITDIRMPPDRTDDGLRAALELRRLLPDTGVMVLSQHLQRRYALELLAEKGGGVGYLLKQRIADVATFVDDVGRVAAGGTVLDPDVVALMVARARGDNQAMDRLTARQLEVLALIAEGRSNAAIARRLGITERAVVQHTSNIYDLLGLLVNDDEHRRVLAALQYLSGR